MMDYDMNERSKPHAWRAFLVLILFKIVLDHALVTTWNQYSAAMADVADPKRAVISWVAYIVTVLLISVLVVRRNDLIALVYCFLFVLNGCGFFSVYPVKEAMTDAGFFTVLAFWTVFTLAIGLLPKNSQSLKPLGISEDRVYGVEYVLFVVSAILTVIYSGIYADFRIFISFEDVYDYRFEFLERSLPTFVSYTMRWISGAILPYFFIRFLLCKKYLFAGASLFLGLMMYGIDGLKTTLLLYVVCIYFYWRVSSFKKKGKSYLCLFYEFLVLLSIGILVCLAIYDSTESNFFNPELFRVFIIPSSIADNYYNFICDKEALLLRESIMRAFFDSPYDESINYLVTNQISANGNRAIANTGLYGDAFANFKYFGVIVYPIIYAVILRLWQWFNRGETNAFSLALAFIMVWNAINISFFTWLLTGGVLLFFALAFIKNRVWKISEEEGELDIETGELDVGTSDVE